MCHITNRYVKYNDIIINTNNQTKKKRETMSIPMKKLGTQGLEVAGLGYGAMGLTAFYGTGV